MKVDYEAARKRKKKAKEKAKRIGTYKVKPAIKIYPSGREVCNLKTVMGRLIYRNRTWEMRYRQDVLCAVCGLPMSLEDTTFDHQDGRGSGGSRRDDRIEINGKPYNRAVHEFCNILKGSKRGYDTTVTRHSEHSI